MSEPTILLVGGPYNGRRIADIGTVIIKMEIAAKWPLVEGTPCGDAVYEPNAERTHAFWVGNDWNCTHVATIGGE
ncbi:MAG: hypothetical protein WC378_18965 [Opitutaceae bacterium]|jgi:hypothetical protein